MQPLRRLGSRLEVVKVVPAAELDRPVERARLAGFLHGQAIYHSACLKDRNTKAKVSVFGTSKMISAGAKSSAYLQIKDLEQLGPLGGVLRECVVGEKL